MDPFSYLAVLISIILGFGITQLLSGLGRLLQERQRVHFHWPTIVWVTLLLLLHVQTWWAMFGLRVLRHWSFLAFLMVLLQPLVLYLLAALVLPNERSEHASDLEAHYFANARWFFGLAVFLLFVSLSRDLVLTGSLPGLLNVSAHALLLAGWSTGAVTRRPAVHRWIAIYTLLLIGGYIATLFRELS